jgi:hypothetical protein
VQGDFFGKKEECLQIVGNFSIIPDFNEDDSSPESNRGKEWIRMNKPNLQTPEWKGGARI